MKYYQLHGYYSAGQAARLLRITRLTLYKWTYEGKLECTRSDRGWRYFKKHQIDKLAAQLNER